MANRWQSTICVVPRKGDYWESLASAYPELAACVQKIVNAAGTSDADAKVLLEAGKIVADYEDWIRRAECAMSCRRATKFDSLCREAKEFGLASGAIADE